MVPVTLTTTESGDPVEGAYIRRARDVNLWEKMINPVGAFYHPSRIFEETWTDSTGKCQMKTFKKKHFYGVTTSSAENLTLTWGSETFYLKPISRLTNIGWNYGLRTEEGEWIVNVREAWVGWDEERPLKSEAGTSQNSCKNITPKASHSCRMMLEESSNASIP